MKTEKTSVVKKAGSATSIALHREISKNEDDNAAVEGAHKLEERRRRCLPAGTEKCQTQETEGIQKEKQTGETGRETDTGGSPSGAEEAEKTDSEATDQTGLCQSEAK